MEASPRLANKKSCKKDKISKYYIMLEILN
jgi:hypothetical protein